MFNADRQMGGNVIMFSMIKTLFTIGVVWILIAFSYIPITTTIEKTQLVDKTKQLVYDIYNKVKKDSKK